jgi:hypothetical protein
LVGKYGDETRCANPIPRPWLQLTWKTQKQNEVYHTVEERGMRIYVSNARDRFFFFLVSICVLPFLACSKNLGCVCYSCCRIFKATLGCDFKPRVWSFRKHCRRWSSFRASGYGCSSQVHEGARLLCCPYWGGSARNDLTNGIRIKKQNTI